MNAVEVAGLTKRYPGGVQAVAGIDLAIAAGSTFALLGPNGAGKSTTVRILTTLAAPDTGTVRVAGIDALTQPAKVRRRIGVVGQRHGSDPQSTGRENLELQGTLYGLRGGELRRRVDAMLDRFDIGHAAGRAVRTYSGGMQRRLDVAMGLMHEPAVLFLDEPTTGLDPEARHDVWKQVGALAAEGGLTILLTTHYLEEADDFADRVAIMDRGLIVAEGTPDELKRSLDGDSIRIQLAADIEPADIESALGHVDGVADVHAGERLLRARAGDGAALTPAVLAALADARIPVASVTIARPSLDDVYLRHAGREFASVAPEGS
ncbi:MAG TPA: ATP-binding cassette domain-containing protein [Gaiellales bacterium]|jgi:ABC-2 type transport system ATP-binding protein|nr:ATP-binding cassette domain-containing protein [Gaiellales bacterium]